MGFFEKVFTFIADLSTRMPDINFKEYFIIVLAFLAGVCLICVLTFLGSKLFKLQIACNKIRTFLKEVECVDDDNARLFTQKCFAERAPQSLRDAWIEYSGVRFGYPSEIISEKNVFEKEIEKTQDIRAKVFVAIGLVVLAFFAFWGYGKLTSSEMGVIHFVGLLLVGIGYFVLVFLNKKLVKKTMEIFEETQEDLDAKVDMQIEKDFATDSSPLLELSSLVDEIVGRNTEKEIVEQEETPIESLIRSQMNASQNDDEQDNEDDVLPEKNLLDLAMEAEDKEVEQEKQEIRETESRESEDKEDINNVPIDNVLVNEEQESEDLPNQVSMFSSNEESENIMSPSRVDVSMHGKSENLFNALNYNYDVSESEKKEWIDSATDKNIENNKNTEEIDIASIANLIGDESKDEDNGESKYSKLLSLMDYINNTKTSQLMKDQIIAMLEEVLNKKTTKKSDAKVIKECINKLKK